MKEEIKGTLLDLRIAETRIRKEAGMNSVLFLIIGVLVLVALYLAGNTGVFIAGGILAIIPCGFLFAIYLDLFFNPLLTHQHAFQKVAQAIEILEKSNAPIAYEEAHRNLEKTLNKLKSIKLIDRIWYNKTNETIKSFLENLEFLVLPALSASNMKTEHLEEIALAIININPEKIKAINETLESDVSYKKLTPPPKWTEAFKTRFRESKILKALYSLVLGYGLILAICSVYVVATQQDFMVFARERPDIVVVGGLIVSGLTFWKT